MGGSSSRQIEILLVDDNPADVRLMIEAFKKAQFSHHLSIAEDGMEALDFLRQEGAYHGAPRPDLILLDLNMPRKNGQEVLAEIKADDNLKNIPVVILTTSQAKDDVVKAYGLHANCYINKPVDFDAFTKVVQTIQDFWFCVVTLPLDPKR